MISRQTADECLTKLGMLKFFPAKGSVILEIIGFFNELCQTDAEAKGLTAAVLSQFSEWPGPAKIREVSRSEIASRRPREAQPEGCDGCIDGYRYAFQIWAGRIAAGPGPERVIKPEGNLHAQAVERDRYQAEYRNSTTHAFYEVVYPCSCPLGQSRNKAHQQ